MVKFRNLVEINNLDDDSIPMNKKFSVEEICHNFRAFFYRNTINRRSPEVSRGGAFPVFSLVPTNCRETEIGYLLYDWSKNLAHLLNQSKVKTKLIDTCSHNFSCT